MKLTKKFFIISLIIFVLSVAFLGSAIYSKRNNPKPLTYCVSIPEPPEGVVVPEEYP